MSASVLPTVIAADPDPLCQQQIVTLLQDSFRCVVAGTLAEASQALMKERPALLIIELDQPDGDGMTLIQQVQADPALRHILIVCVTRRASIKDKVWAFRAGVDDYFVKPLLPSMNFEGQMLLLRRAGHFARATRARQSTPLMERETKGTVYGRSSGL